MKNLINEINTFFRIAGSLGLSSSSRMLYLSLLHKANSLFWLDPFTVPASELQSLSGLSQSGIQRARRDLINAKLIIYKNRGSNRAAEYSLPELTNDFVSFILTNTTNNTPTNTPTNSPVGTPTNSPNTLIYNTKQNKNISPTTPKMAKSAELESDFEKLWNLYPRKERKADALRAYKKAIKAGTTNKEIQDGIVAYTRSVANTDKQYIAQGGTWFNQQRWQDVVDEPVHHTQGFQDNYDEVMKAYEQ